jgi:cytoskeletal protein CcmA (bactofilin family)
MAANVTVIGRGARVRGRIVGTGTADLEVLGFVEGEIAIGGDVTIDASGIVGANVSGRKLVVRGAVKGDLSGEEAILLEEGARVLGDVKAPRVAIAPGALVRGYVETGQGGAAPARTAARTHAATSPASLASAAAPKHAPHAASAARAHAAATPSQAKAAAPAVRLAGGRHESTSSSASSDRGARRPPPPIVPVLKKAKGQIAKKKER